MFYVYGLIDESTGQCFYVGKGCNNRLNNHLAAIKKGRSTKNPHLDNKLKKLILNNIEVVPVKFYEHLTEDDAFLKEEEKILELGLSNLCNMWSSGKGGKIPSLEVRQKQSIAKQGTTQSEETKQKKSTALKGKPQTEKQKAANISRSNSHKGKKLSEDHKQKLKEAKLENPVRYWQDKHLSDEHKQKISKTLKEKK